ncbi:DsbA family protein [Paracoccus sp. 1_MG-2023]|uniref:DsbA family protein n=1 Tax=unclassified Paracoccus (in: a-proteobacteria) TaxID=2688777 RepID=UPI001C0A4035|nr:MULTISPECIES: DsbA family protein [unclassified Paracoccus (in: a-proteobacteria)]MBU2956919.1 DsbA family protein [Paracoccus sp. C2R09]MDO6668117.1 DsbA family protein [Paracoccus sp. 1_MG-2023]
MFLRHAATAIALSLAVPAAAQEAETLPDVVLGDADAPVTVIEYASFTCGHCANFHENVYPDLKAEYIDTGKVKFIQRDIYFDQPGLWAGVLARCAGDDKFYPVADMLFDEQSEWLSGGSGDEIAAQLRRIGLKAGMTEEQMTACWNDTAKVEQLIATFQKNATADGIEATPTFVIEGEKVNNQPWEGLKEVIEAKLEDAE